MDPDSIDELGRVPHGSSDEAGVLDLSANVNPQVPAGSREVYEAAFEDARSYPNDDYPAFCAAAADYVGCDTESVVPTAGGLAALRLAIDAVVSPGESVLVPYPSFGEYAREVELAGGDPAFVPAGELLECDPTDHAMAIVCTPNNPTGALPAADTLEAFAERCRNSETVLVVDEAFLGFTDRDSLAGHAGVVVVRSLTKLFGLPGLRGGFAVAGGELSGRLETARMAWSLGGPAATVGAHAMADRTFVAETRKQITRQRQYLTEELEKLRFDVRRSSAPFVLVDVGEPPGELLAACRSHDVVLRDATTFRGLDTHVRIAVRDRTATDRLLAVLEEVRGR